MNFRRAVVGLVVGMVLMLAAQDANAADRKLWKHSEGYFVKLKGDHWQERGTKDEGKFNYHEVGRNDEFVHLFDKARGVDIRLRNDACMYKDEKGEKYKKIYDGNWAD